MDEFLENLNVPIRFSIISVPEKNPNPLTCLNQIAIQLMKRLTTDNRLPKLRGISGIQLIRFGL